MTTSVVKVANRMVAYATARTNHKKATTVCADFPCSSLAHFCFSFVGCIYHGSSILLCGGNFHFCCGTSVSLMCVT